MKIQWRYKGEKEWKQGEFGPRVNILGEPDSNGERMIIFTSEAPFGQLTVTRSEVEIKAL